jgi:hypothetical protein
MYPISAADSVSLAVQRTKEFLFRPFAWGTYLKLGLVAILTEGIGSNFHSGSSHAKPSGTGPMNGLPFDFTPQVIAVIVAAVLVAIVLGIVIFYFITRLRFAFFHCLIHNTKQIRPGWKFYREQASRFFWLNLGVGFCFLLIVGLIAIPFVGGFWRLIHDTAPGGQPDIMQVLALVLPLIPIVILLVLAGLVLDIILRDWMLPHYALDDASAREAWQKVWENITAEKRQFLVYVLLRLILPMIAGIAVFVVLLIPGLVLAGAAAAAIYAVHTSFADATGAAMVAGIAIQAFFGVIACGFALLASICLGGPVSTAVREYAILFYAGRYPALGEILEPMPPPAFQTATGQ